MDASQDNSKAIELLTHYETPQYIGDGVYVHFDGYQVWLRTERHSNRGVSMWHEIALDPHTWNQLRKYKEKLDHEVASL